MATIEKRPSKVGKATIWRVKWRAGGVSRTLTKRLRTGRPLRKRRRRAHQRRIRFIEAAMLIEARPAVIELRSRIGTGKVT